MSESIGVAMAMVSSSVGGSAAAVTRYLAAGLPPSGLDSDFSLCCPLLQQRGFAGRDFKIGSASPVLVSCSSHLR